MDSLDDLLADANAAASAVEPGHNDNDLNNNNLDNGSDDGEGAQQHNAQNDGMPSDFSSPLPSPSRPRLCRLSSSFNDVI